LTDIIGTAGNDTLTGTPANEAFYGLDGEDVITGGGGNDTFDGGAGNDTITAGSGTDILDGGDGDDLLMGGAGADVIDGGAGYDRVSYADYTTDLTIDLAAGTASDGDQFTNIEGAIGGSGDDTITGDAGANIIDGGLGADAIDGGLSFDTITFTGRTTSVTVNLATGTTSDGDTLTSIEAATGGEADDSLTGDIWNNVLDGGLGADTLDGGDGNDYVSYAYRLTSVTANLATGANTDGDSFTSIENLIGGWGNDTLTGDAGANILQGGGGNDTLLGGLGDDTLDGGDGADTIDGGDGFDTVSYVGAGAGMRIDLTSGQAGEGNYAGFSTGTPIDQLQNVEAILGSDHNDVIFSIDGARIDGGRGNDILISSAGSDTLIGNEGLDGVAYLEAASGVTANLATGMGTAGEANGDIYTGIENLYGSQFDDVIMGDDGDNRLSGSSGDDILIGGLGEDALFGGDGFDYASYEDRTTGITVNLGTAEGNEDRFSSIEGLIGGSGDDVLNGTSIDNIFLGGDGNDRLAGGNGDDVLIGGNGDDLLRGGSGADRLEGGAGIDTASYVEQVVGRTIDLVAGTSSEGDQLIDIENVIGGQSGDLIISAVGANVIDGHYGSDTVSYEVFTTNLTIDIDGVNSDGDTLISIENLIGGSGNDTLSGGEFANTLDGGAGNDVLAGGNGDDALIGGTGDDLLRGGNGIDIINGGDGFDTASYLNQWTGQTIDLATGDNTHGDTLISIEGVIGGTAGDTITGDAGNNRIDGHSGNDTLSGGDGDDVLIGGSGRDIMTGGNGADRFVFQSLTDSGAGTSSRDRIMDLDIAAGDRIDLSTFDIDPSTSTHETMTYIGSGAYTGTAGEVRIAASANAGYTSVGIDTDGDGTSNFLFEVALPVADFSADAFLL
jgi:Ca2+-binding RTX toxin-like protein